MKEESKIKKTSNEFIKSYFNFYNNSLKKKHIIIFIISLLLFGFTICNYISNMGNEDYLSQIKNIVSNEQENVLLNQIFIKKVPIAAVIVIAGITPYIYIPAIGVLTGYQIANEMIQIISSTSNTVAQNILLMSIGAIIQILGFSLSIASGIYFCYINSKRSKYYRGKEKSFFDIKKEYYNFKNDIKKIKQLENFRKKKEEENIKNYVKIPYINLIASLAISLVLVIIGTFIFYL